MPQENFPKYNILGFKNTTGVNTRPHFNFLKSLRNKPELIYNILSIDINEINKGENKNRRKENKNKEEIKIGIKNEDIPLLFDYIFNLFYGGSISNKKIEEYVLALIWTFLIGIC